VRLLLVLMLAACGSSHAVSASDGGTAPADASNDWEPCDADSECASDRCVHLYGSTAVCSSFCQSSADCPAGWQCPIEDNAYCLPTP
jgi:hypothetical protein